MLGDISVADNIYIVCGTTDMRKSIDGLCSIDLGQSFPWIRTSHPCSYSAGNGVTGSRSCSVNRMDVCSFTRG
ncbi:MAG: hypothetical protein ACLTW9_12150 [Enterocloster sp.]